MPNLRARDVGGERGTLVEHYPRALLAPIYMLNSHSIHAGEVALSPRGLEAPLSVVGFCGAAKVEPHKSIAVLITQASRKRRGGFFSIPCTAVARKALAKMDSKSEMSNGARSQSAGRRASC